MQRAACLPRQGLEIHFVSHYGMGSDYAYQMNLFTDYRMVCGVQDIELQWLPAKQNLNLQMVLNEAQAAEMSSQSMAEIQKSNSLPISRKADTIPHDDLEQEELDDDDDVYCLKSSRKQSAVSGRKQIACMDCGSNHLKADCRFKNTICQRCDRKGHLAKVCHTSQPASQPYHRKA
ncbi:hypothetical protein E2320_004999 [Naja naja]|nr:hypothetical protein E2320_004999 [Naja naja]